jgi:HNH endonuclease
MESFVNDMNCLICKKTLSKNQVKRKNKTCCIECRGKQHSITIKGFGLGRKLSEETKRKIGKANSVSLLGKHCSPNTEFKKGNQKLISAYSFGKNFFNPSWKGGITPLNHLLRNSAKYRKWRKAVFERDNYTCQICGIRGCYLQADHIKPWSLYPEFRYVIDNGRTLCVSCHRKTDTWGYNVVKKIYGKTRRT